MIHLITGGSGSGKSAYAEQSLIEDSEKKEKNYLYIAAMQPFGEETMRKIERHRRLREGKGFRTIERYTDLKTLTLPENSGVLLECISNLTANEWYREDGMQNGFSETKKNIIEGICHIAEQTKHLVIVTNEVCSDVWDYSDETKVYIRLIGEVNQELAQMADKVTEVVYGIPLHIMKKDEKNVEQF